MSRLRAGAPSERQAEQYVIVSQSVLADPNSLPLPKADRRRALELLASSPTGCTEALLFAYGITIEMLIGLIEAGLASATPERVVEGKRAMQITRVRITDAGRRALAGT